MDPVVPSQKELGNQTHGAYISSPCSPYLTFGGRTKTSLTQRVDAHSTLSSSRPCLGPSQTGETRADQSETGRSGLVDPVVPTAGATAARLPTKKAANGSGESGTGLGMFRT